MLASVINRDTIRNVQWSSFEISAIFAPFLINIEFFLTDCRKILKYQMSLKSEQWLPTELFCVERTNRKTDSQPDRQTDRRDVTKIIVAFAILQNRLKDL